jgi:hypothetical protein
MIKSYFGENIFMLKTSNDLDTSSTLCWRQLEFRCFRGENLQPGEEIHLWADVIFTVGSFFDCEMLFWGMRRFITWLAALSAAVVHEERLKFLIR